ncbi:MAG: hypothetical protein MJ159_02535, partial [Treponemataceae bacterium]|nr:hypothetical protein [Treponemataceae bacterium]
KPENLVFDSGGFLHITDFSSGSYLAINAYNALKYRHRVIKKCIRPRIFLDVYLTDSGGFS